MKYKYEAIFCIVNAGFSEEVMKAAREVGAQGGTVISANGTANVQAESLFGITIQPRKEIVLILVESDIKEAVLKALYHAVGLKTAGQGVAFALPAKDVVGLRTAGKQKALPQVDGDNASPSADEDDLAISDENEDDGTPPDAPVIDKD